MSKNIDQDLLARLSDGLPAEEAALCIGRVLRINRDASEALAYTEERAHQALVAQTNLQVQLGITSDDRDARRRRMELAALILDFERTLPLEEVSAVLLGTSVAVPRKDYDYYTSRDHEYLRTAGFPSHLPDISSIPTPKCLECSYTGPQCQDFHSGHETTCSLYMPTAADICPVAQARGHTPPIHDWEERDGVTPAEHYRCRHCNADKFE